ncbi:PREDICTED: pathogenesis-related protein PR-1 [Tarenaya hassleriana]|uniref:pathogenesis-related protein PR-1 n=1 Tax=Tarenaya hassleriana TaxID=28532 RepID=UPI00053CAA00|nr:PREDICTED: pathogenesis-related protein PR-1 [Tarenaya hassleriana]
MATPIHVMTKSIRSILTLITLVTLNANAQYESQFMNPQNAARTHLRLNPLAWDKRLERYAMWWANQRRKDCALIHSNGPYGENLFWGSGKNWSPVQAANGWLSEARNYNYNDNACNGGERMCGHYTQIMWRETRRIGCARVLCDGGLGVFIICNYDPPGNFLGRRPY